MFWAELPAETILWIVIGIAWAIAQLFTKSAMKRARQNQAAPPANSRTPTQRPATTVDPVSPDEELRRFLREVSGQVEEDATEPVRPSRPAVQAPPRTPPVRRTAHPAPVRMTLPKPHLPTEPANTPILPKPAAKPSRPSLRRPSQVQPGLFDDWRIAVIQREILGPPRAIKPYSSNEY